MHKKYYKLKGHRVLCGFTQGDMAAAIGKSVSSYRRKENGQTDFRLREVIAILEKLNSTPYTTTLEYLFS